MNNDTSLVCKAFLIALQCLIFPVYFLIQVSSLRHTSRYIHKIIKHKQYVKIRKVFEAQRFTTKQLTNCISCTNVTDRGINVHAKSITARLSGTFKGFQLSVIVKNQQIRLSVELWNKPQVYVHTAT